VAHNSCRFLDNFPSRFPVLHGEGLTLRELVEDDLPAWLARLSDAEAAALAGDPVATSMKNVVEGLDHHRDAFRERSGLRWAIVPDELSASVGSIGFVRLNQSNRMAEVGAAIGRAHWGRGIATRAARLVLDYGFSTLQLAAVEAVVLPENARTIRVLERLGFAHLSGPCPSDRVVNGRRDSLFYFLDRGSWRAAVRQKGRVRGNTSCS
jgi:RimJ/RimL family protein N-acetyltransferase